MAEEKEEKVKKPTFVIDTDNLAESNKLMEAFVEKQMQIKQLTGEIATAEEAAVTAAKMKAKIYDEAREAKAEEILAYQKMFAEAEEARQAILDNAALSEEARERQLKQHDDTIAKNQEEQDELIKQVGLINEAGEAYKAVAKGIEEGEAALKSMNTSLGSVLSLATGIGDKFKGGAMGATLMSFKTAGMGATLKGIGKTLKDTFSITNIAGSFLQGMVEQTLLLVKATDSAQAAMARSTGQGRIHDEQITKIYKSNQKYGVSVEESGAALSAFKNNMAGFNREAPEVQNQLVGIAAKMGELGVANEVMAEFFENTTRVMGKSHEESMQLAADMQKLAGVIGKDLGPLMSDFNSTMSDLAIYGDDATKEFAKLSSAAMELGISVDSLVGSMKEMDTISGAATRAGQLNAALEGQFLDTHKLLNASYSERLVMIKEGLVASGKEFKSMGRAEKQMVANAAGLKDVGELAKLMSTDMKELKKGMSAAAEASGTIGAIGEAAISSQQFMERWGQTLEKLAQSAQPLLTAGYALLEWVNKFFDAIGDTGVQILGGLAIAFFIIMGLMKAKTRATQNDILATIQSNTVTIQSAQLSVINANAKGLESAANATETGTTISNTTATGADNVVQGTSNTVKKVGFLGTLRLIGAKIWNTAVTWAGRAADMASAAAKWALAGITTILTWLFGLQSTSQTAVATTAGPAAVGTAAVGTASWYAAIPVAILAVGLGMMAIGLGLVAIAIAAVVWAFVYFIKLLLESPEAAAGLVGTLVELSFAMYGLALAGMMMIPGAIGMVTGLGIMGAGLLAFAGIAWLVTDTIQELAEALAAVSEDRTMLFTAMMREVGEAAQVLTPEAVENIDGLVEAADAYSEIKWSGVLGGGVDMDPFANMLKTALGNKAGGGGGGGAPAAAGAPGGTPTVVTLELDGVTLGRTVESLLGKRNKLKSIT
jgi:hypothetical protein